ncbi:unnamed protein product [Pseudo-nitzschia multistriata]|uniref:Uncharacterized protein n=1 Tax=Pseudo-nitzschia multistriata TaxID=183589 RepID=A0A448ZNN5_9STRA|nr:unnamed protein product [Pseudo-nitzschia multistriata]
MRIGNHHHHHHHHLSSSTAPGSMVAAVASSPALETVSYDFNRSRSSESTEAVHTHHKTEKAKAGASSSPAATPSPTPSAALVSPSVAPCAYADSRGVPVSPKKIPMTPPRDLSSPFRAFPPAPSGLPHQRGLAGAGAAAAAAAATGAATATAAVAVPPSPVRQPFLWCSEDSNATGERPARRPRSSPFLRPSTGSKHCHPKAGGNSSSSSHHTATGAFLSPIFRSKGLEEEAAAAATVAATPIEDDNDKGHALDLFAIRRCNAFDEDDASDDASDESGDPFGVELGLGHNFGVNFGFSGENHGNGYY